MDIPRKGDCGGTPRVGKVGDPKPRGRGRGRFISDELYGRGLAWRRRRGRGWRNA